MFGEVGVLCGKLQPFGVQTNGISQILHLNKTTFLSILQSNPEDERCVMNNLFQKLKEWKIFDVEGQHDLNLGIENSNIQDSRFMNGDQTSLHVAANEGLYTRRRIMDESVGSGSPRKREKRVIIHMNFGKFKVSENQPPKLIILPDSLEELLKIAGEKFGDESVARVVSAENAQIDDLSVVRDGDHLFLLPSV
ncbi:hypothetical protein ACS0TY_018342 [Phlomoides rotata]